MDQPTPVPPSAEETSPDQLRNASFPQAFKGYDREAVHAFLDRVASWVEGGAAGLQQAVPDVRRELERVGERTAGILTAAEEAAAKVRAEAAEYAASIRETADEDLRRATAEANRKAEELVADAESRAERIVDEALARRRQLNQAIASLAERRDEIADEAQRLADELLGAVDGLRTDRAEPGDDLVFEEVDSGVEEGETPDAADPAADEEVTEEDASETRTGRFATSAEEPAEPAGEDEPETAIHRTG